LTYNAGKTGSGIQQTPLGYVSPSNLRNRGCMSQLGSRCLADEGKKVDAILKFYYGDDIAITQATGACIPAVPKADAGSDAATADAGAADGAPGSLGSDAATGGGEHLGTSTPTAAPFESHASADASGCSVTRAAGTSTSSRWAFVAFAALALMMSRRQNRAPSSRPGGRPRAR
jgi:hypothetical protein